MVNEIIYSVTLLIAAVACGIGLVSKAEQHVKIICLGVAAFISLGAVDLSYNESVPYYAYVPLAIAIISIIYMVYVVFTIITSNNRDWGNEVDEENEQEFNYEHV
jgi:phosphotransferase system  glucose/maltose/N-acetylglucosamine-specific IIC component